MRTAGVHQGYGWQRSSVTSMRSSMESLGGRSTISLVPVREVVRVKYAPLSDESGGSDDEADTQLLRKYGIVS
jgi:hypothetical protein